VSFDESRLSIKYEVILEYDGKPLLDSKLANLLKLLREKGSLLAASKALGIPYSRAWESIARIERVLNSPLITAIRGGKGGGGTRLTTLALRLLELYDSAERKLRKLLGGATTRKYLSIEEPDIIIAYSHDPLLELAIGKLRSSGFNVEGLCIGSGLALAALSLGEADVACLHLYDPNTSEYNRPYIERYWLNGKVESIGYYGRELVFALRPGLQLRSVDDVIMELLQGNLKLVNRNRGSGTRVFLDYLINSIGKRYGLKVNTSRIKGYGNEVTSHIEAARIVAQGKADVALVLRYASELYNLNYIHVTWERYECIALKEVFHKQAVKEFKEIINSEWFKHLLKKSVGYEMIM